MSQRLKVARQAALAAGELLLEMRRSGLAVERKGRIDLVSAADRAAEELIRRELTAAFPSDVIVGEEGNEVPEDEVHGRSRWYVDPLDGTTNYLHGWDRWAVSIAFCSPDDQLKVAVVHLPATGQTFTALRGAGAWLDGVSLQVTEVSNLQEALVGSGFPYVLESGPTNLEEWAAVTLRARSMRCLGAAAVDLCDVAAGRLDAFFEQRLGRWDTAAGILIASEAGAVVTDLDGRATFGASPDVVAASQELHTELLGVLRGVRD